MLSGSTPTHGQSSAAPAQIRRSLARRHTAPRRVNVRGAKPVALALAQRGSSASYLRVAGRRHFRYFLTINATINARQCSQYNEKHDRVPTNTQLRHYLDWDRPLKKGR